MRKTDYTGKKKKTAFQSGWDRLKPRPDKQADGKSLAVKVSNLNFDLFLLFVCFH